MSHSKRNTSLAFFTSHERNQLKSHWGSQSTRLNRDSFLPFASCALCLQPSRDPVACASHGDIFCRECIVSNLLAQRKAIKRAEKDEERRRRENAVEKEEKAEEERERSVRDFERTMMGLEGTSRKGNTGTSTDMGTSKDVGGRGAKRKFSLDANEVAKNEHDDRAKARKAIDDEKASIPTLPAFWVPSLTPSTNSSTHASSPLNRHPLCPSSAPQDPHPLSLKTLITITFSTATTTTSSSKDSPTHTCPACAKPLSNASKAILAIPCGHVVCKPCAAKFMSVEKNPHAGAGEEEEEGGVRCYVCSMDLTPSKSTQEVKKKEEKVRRGTVELRSEGTGFAGGGKNMARRGGVAFQC